MRCTPTEREQKERFAAVYERTLSPAMQAVERSVCDCDYGGNIWLSREQAEYFGTCLQLKAGMRLLDLGAGSGWPALYPAKTFGCDAMLVDLPEIGLQIAKQCAHEERSQSPKNPRDHGESKRSRRELLRAARTPSIDTGTYKLPVDEVPIPPADAEVLPTACEYCIVGCGYKVYRWPYHRQGAAGPDQNTLKEQFPTGPVSGKWVSPNMHNVVPHKGESHHIVIVPDGEAVVNRQGNHSVRGGTLGLKPYNPKRPTAERLQTPMVRLRSMLHAISWEDAPAIAAELGRYAIDTWGEAAWGIK